jgi:hypothetical protein
VFFWGVLERVHHCVVLPFASSNGYEARSLPKSQRHSQV